MPQSWEQMILRKTIPRGALKYQRSKAIWPRLERLLPGVNQLNVIELEATSADPLGYFLSYASLPQSVASLVDVPALVSASWPP